MQDIIPYPKAARLLPIVHYRHHLRKGSGSYGKPFAEGILLPANLSAGKITEGVNPYKLNTSGFKAGMYTYKILKDKNVIDNGKLAIVK